MILLPAVDILEGKAVRLARGEFDQRTVYDADPLEAARRWFEGGAHSLHVVDLDGARTGAPVNLDQVRRITSEVPVPVQVGGGLRTIESVREAFAAGAARAVLGTAAYQDVDFLDQAIAEFGDRVVVSVDVRDGHVAAAAWTEQTDIPLEAVIEHLSARGVRRFVYSSIDRDGMLAGPDLDGARRVGAAVRGTYTYSGGVSSLEDLRGLVELRQVNLGGVIVGKALYEGKFSIAAGQAALGGR